ncbi:MAG: hypothetical protein L0I24_17235, partial [Pseudonocardia sp.]|nr:hypothetical protein [Pseudonocardia sp.]
ERAFEDRVEHELLEQGWVAAQGTYRPELGLDTGELVRFIGATQQKKWDKLIELYGGDQPTAQRQFAQRLASEIDARGVLDVLRQGVNTFAPATPSPPTQRTTSTRPTACWTSSTTVPDLAGVPATRS